jgi:hypothetical protein
MDEMHCILLLTRGTWFYFFNEKMQKKYYSNGMKLPYEPFSYRWHFGIFISTLHG